jgi:hypothetical protein
VMSLVMSVLVVKMSPPDLMSSLFFIMDVPCPGILSPVLLHPPTTIYTRDAKSHSDVQDTNTSRTKSQTSGALRQNGKSASRVQTQYLK